MDYESFMEEVEQNGLVFFDYTYGFVGPCPGFNFEFSVSIGYLFEGEKYNFVYPVVINHTEEDTVEDVKTKIVNALQGINVKKIKDNLLVLTDPDENTDNWYGDGVKNPEAVADFIKDNPDVFKKAVADLNEIKKKFEYDVNNDE